MYSARWCPSARTTLVRLDISQLGGDDGSFPLWSNGQRNARVWCGRSDRGDVGQLVERSICPGGQLDSDAHRVAVWTISIDRLFARSVRASCLGRRHASFAGWNKTSPPRHFEIAPSPSYRR